MIVHRSICLEEVKDCLNKEEKGVNHEVNSAMTQSECWMSKVKEKNNLSLSFLL
ncbi:hypothetical protein [Staphylococcus delphini]|uniref:hypothetical protein n=1 Tax=Staphylococcus delphini TaxID=53344 RepID=UPI0012D2A6CA|nr:hypothetical protein [Staphylococcus delphini]MTV23129.1 hypothetical protein [Staphylococcus delphini]